MNPLPCPFPAATVRPFGCHLAFGWMSIAGARSGGGGTNIRKRKKYNVE